MGAKVQILVSQQSKVNLMLDPKDLKNFQIMLDEQKQVGAHTPGYRQ